MLYFSYGSNMSSARLHRRVSSAAFVSVATLGAHALRFHKLGHDGSGKCDAWATAESADAVIGVVFEISAADKAILDRYEGLGNGYDHKQVRLVTSAGAMLEAVMYVATRTDGSLTPYDWYLAHVLAGAREHALPDDYVDAIAAVASVADPDRARHAREMAIYR